jgi:D-3-phosphoglycerate dehydrogenase
MRKLLIFVNDEQGKEPFMAEHIAKKFGEFDQYGVEVSYAVDSSLASNDRPEIAPTLRIEQEGPEWVRYDPRTLEAVKDAELLLVGFNGVSSGLLRAAEKLKFVGVLRSGVENVNVAACSDAGVIVCNAPGRVSEPVADFTVAMILGFNRNISRDDISKRAGWRHPAAGDFKPPLLSETTIGLIGFGIIGKKVAQRLQGFRPRMIAYDPYADAAEAAALGVELLSMEEVMRRSDFVSVHARLLPATQGLIGEKELSYMKPTAVFVNTARAGLVDEDALVKALSEKRIRGAALDVFSMEPLPEDHPLRSLDNVLLAPHSAGGAGDTFTITIDIMREELHRYFKGEALRNRIN